MDELHYWNITFDTSNAALLYEALNELQPGLHNVGGLRVTPITTMIELREEDALLLGLKANVRIERLDKEEI